MIQVCSKVIQFTYIYTDINSFYIYTLYINSFHIYINIYIYFLFQILFQYRLLQDIEYNSLCYTVVLVLFCDFPLPLLVIYPTEISLWIQTMYKGIQRSFLYNSPELETIQMSINRRKDK